MNFLRNVFTGNITVLSMQFADKKFEIKIPNIAIITAIAVAIFLRYFGRSQASYASIEYGVDADSLAFQKNYLESLDVQRRFREIDLLSTPSPLD
jgi:hypothetical protein